MSPEGSEGALEAHREQWKLRLTGWKPKLSNVNRAGDSWVHGLSMNHTGNAIDGVPWSYAIVLKELLL